MEELKAEWQSLFGRSPPPHAGRNFLIGNLRWQQQAAVHGGLSKTTKRRLRTLADTFRQNPDYRPPAARPPIKPGTRLVRQWQGDVHEVTVEDGSFRYRGKRYPSLSAIARSITGTRWSGPTFFGLNGNGRERT